MTRLILQLPLAFCLATQTLSAAAWETLSDSEATAAGWSRGKLSEARAYAATIQTEAVMIIAQGKVLDAWGAVDQKFNVHSIRKSFLSALYGMRVTEGLVNLDSTMADLGIDDNEPGLTKTEKKATVHDLLKSRSGIYHPALYETPGMKAQRPKRHSHEPGSFWYYNNWDFNVLGSIYEQACQTGIFQDFKRLIAKPLGMEDYKVVDGNYVTGPDSIHPAYPFRMSARDMARFGLLFLRMGKWGDRQIVPEEWVKASTTSYSTAGTSGGYGYLWWVFQNGVHLPGVTLPEGSYSARGAGGHYILNIPALDLVIVHRVNTDLKDQSVSSSEFGELVRRILAAYQPPASASLETLVPLLMTQHHVPGAAVLRLRQLRIQFLQRVIEQITGNSFESLQQRLLLAPLGMSHSSHVWSKDIAAHAAAGHDASGKVKPKRAHYTTS